MSTDTNTQPGEDIKSGEAKPNEVQPATEPKKEEQPIVKKDETTIGDALNIPKTPEKISKKPETVPFEVFESMKKEFKETIRELKSSSKTIEDLDLSSIAEKYNVDETFLASYAEAVEKKLTKQFEEKYAGKFEELDRKSAESKINKAFKVGFDRAMSNLPGMEKIVNPKVIKTLSLQKENANKTFTDLILETYGNAVQGKPTIERTTPRGGQEPQTLNFSKAQSDPAYFKEVMADPELKAQYNDALIKSGAF